MAWHKEFTWGTHAIGNKNTIIKTNFVVKVVILVE